MSDKWKVFLLIGMAVVAASLGEALASKGMKKAQEAGGVLAVVQAAAQDWHVVVGLILFLAYVFLYIYALGLADLSFAVPLLAFSYLFGLVSARFYLKEEIPPGRLIGTLIIIAGVVTVALAGQGGGGDREKGDTEPEQEQLADG
ncbi:MAG: EamA family transporter [Capsulimonadales bacterium]|nr:EamA family transporter [Capsulimonadales bacterium]